MSYNVKSAVDFWKLLDDNQITMERQGFAGKEVNKRIAMLITIIVSLGAAIAIPFLLSQGESQEDVNKALDEANKRTSQAKGETVDGMEVGQGEFSPSGDPNAPDVFPYGGSIIGAPQKPGE